MFGKHCPRETFATASRKFFVPNELPRFSISVVPFKQVQTLIASHELICSFNMTLIHILSFRAFSDSKRSNGVLT